MWKIKTNPATGLYSSRGGVAAIDRECRRFNPLKTRSANLTKVNIAPRNLPVLVGGTQRRYARKCRYPLGVLRNTSVSNARDAIEDHFLSPSMSLAIYGRVFGAQIAPHERPKSCNLLAIPQSMALLSSGSLPGFRMAIRNRTAGRALDVSDHRSFHHCYQISVGTRHSELKNPLFGADFSRFVDSSVC